jgi:hypothetical protein
MAAVEANLRRGQGAQDLGGGFGSKELQAVWGEFLRGKVVASGHTCHAPNTFADTGLEQYRIFCTRGGQYLVTLHADRTQVKRERPRSYLEDL